MERFGGLLAAGFLFLLAVVPARAQQTCSLTQITLSPAGAGGDSFNPAINPAGNRIAFESDADLLGSNPDRSFEVFLWDASTGLTQITDLDHLFSMGPTINGAGNRIAFVANTDPLGSNADRNTEVFLWEAATGLTQITTTNSGDSSFPSIDATGDHIAFTSNANPLGTNGDGHFELFLWGAPTGLTQITNTTSGESFFAVINASGTRIAFQSEANPLGNNADGNFEIFLWDTSTGLAQITSTAGGSSTVPAINAAGNRIAFQSSADLVGSNSDGNNEIFLWDSATGFAQITNTLNVSSFAPAINAAGNRITFESNADLLGNGSGSLEIFLWDASSGFTQLTNSPVNSLSSTINAAGDRISFSSTADLLGTGSDGTFEVFLAACPLLQEASIPAVSPLGLGILATLLGLTAIWTLRRRREQI